MVIKFLKFCVLLAILIFPLTTWATIEFRANIPSVEMSEEAILLLECLAARNKTNWELVENFQGPLRLSIKAKDNELDVIYTSGEDIQSALLRKGLAQVICDQFTLKLKAQDRPAEINPILWEKTQIESEPTNKKKWLLLGLGGAAIATGIFLFLSHRTPEPQYSSIQLK